MIGPDRSEVLARVIGGAILPNVDQPARATRDEIRLTAARLEANGFDFANAEHRRAAAAIFIAISEMQHRYEANPGGPLEALESILGFMEVCVALQTSDPFPDEARP